MAPPGQILNKILQPLQEVTKVLKLDSATQLRENSLHLLECAALESGSIECNLGNSQPV